VRRAAGGNHQQPVERELIASGPHHRQVSEMRRVELAAEHADPHQAGSGSRAG
jgi:hypothetical protein